MSYLFKTEHYEMVLKAGDMERVLPALIWHLEDLRVGQSYPNFYVARLASKFVKVVLSGAAATSCSPATRGATTAPSSTTTSSTTSTSTTASGSGCVPNRRDAATSSAPTSGATSSDVRDDRHLPRRVRRTTRRSPTPGGVRQPLALLRGEDVPARPARRRGQAEHGARPRDARAVPRQRPRRLRDARARRGSSCATSARSCGSTRTSPGRRRSGTSQQTRDGKLLLRERHGALRPRRRSRDGRSSRASRGRTRAGSAARASTTSAACSTTEGANLRVPGAEDGPALVDEHLEGRENRRLLIWSLLSFEHWCRTFLDGERP